MRAVQAYETWIKVLNAMTDQHHQSIDALILSFVNLPVMLQICVSIADHVLNSRGGRNYLRYSKLSCSASDMVQTVLKHFCAAK